MKKLLIALALFAAIPAVAQENENEKAMRELEKQGYFGNFGYRPDEIHTINVNYSITPRVPTTEVNVVLHTPEPRPLSIVVLNDQGKKVKSWDVQRDEYIKEGTIDVSSLKAGKYKYAILWDGKSAYEIPFEKK